jgi:predicted membrane protein
MGLLCGRNTEFRVHGTGFRVQGTGFRVDRRGLFSPIVSLAEVGLGSEFV